MLQTEYLRSLNCNYERILLEKKPEERKYQYCILSRGGIKGLLSCSLRYINGLAYLYYDISSKQNIVQLYDKRSLERRWIKDFFWSMRQIQAELARFLLDGQNILWYPGQIFQDLENNIFFYLYVPYYEGDNGFRQLLEYFVEHIDYEDDVLVECTYKLYEQYERLGEVYLQEQIFEDVKMLDGELGIAAERPAMLQDDLSTGNEVENNVTKNISMEKQERDYKEKMERNVSLIKDSEEDIADKRREKRGLLSLFEGKKKKEKQIRDDYTQAMQLSMKGYAVAEDAVYEEAEWGKTIYVETGPEPAQREHYLCTEEGRVVAQLNKACMTIGKKKGEADLVLEDMSVSRLHARITKEGEEMYIEDLNSTNGTFKNGLRMEPYEKRRLEEGDEIKFGKKVFVYC